MFVCFFLIHSCFFTIFFLKKHRGQASVDLTTAVFDGQEKLYSLEKKNEKTGYELSLGLVQGAAAPVINRGRTATLLVEQIKQAIKSAQASGGLNIGIEKCVLFLF